MKLYMLIYKTEGYVHFMYTVQGVKKIRAIPSQQKWTMLSAPSKKNSWASQ